MFFHRTAIANYHKVRQFTLHWDITRVFHDAMRCIPITKTNILLSSVAKTIILTEKMAKITNIKITEI